MAQKLRNVMTADPLLLQKTSTIDEAALAMKGQDIGDVLVMDGDDLCGILTDRDIVVRAVAEGRNPKEAKVGDIASTGLATLSPDDPVSDAVEILRERAVRRIPIVENGTPVGIVSLGDLAVERDNQSALADISAAPAND